MENNLNSQSSGMWHCLGCHQEVFDMSSHNYCGIGSITFCVKCNPIKDLLSPKQYCPYCGHKL